MEKIKPVVTENYEFEYRDESKKTKFWIYRSNKNLMQRKGHIHFNQKLRNKFKAFELNLDAGK